MIGDFARHLGNGDLSKKWSDGFSSHLPKPFSLEIYLKLDSFIGIFQGFDQVCEKAIL